MKHKVLRYGQFKHYRTYPEDETSIRYSVDRCRSPCTKKEGGGLKTPFCIPELVPWTRGASGTINNTMTIKEVDTDYIPSWERRYLVFKLAPFIVIRQN